jgi:hypothetical protein
MPLSLLLSGTGRGEGYPGTSQLRKKKMSNEKSGPFGGPFCKHVKLDGTGCAQPALRLKEFCRFHYTLYDPVVMPGQPLYRPPILEDTASVQIVIMQVIRELMRQPIDKSNAGLILYGLQLASNNLARFRELYPPPPAPEEEEGSGDSLAALLLRKLGVDPSEPQTTEPPGFVAPIPMPLTDGE